MLSPSNHTDAGHTTSTRTFKSFLVTILMVICLVVISVFWGFQYRSSRLMREEIANQARAFFQEVVLTRSWIASHGGVYVKLRPGMEINQYLKKIPGLKVVIHDKDDVPYTLKNPALVTRELSEIAAKQGMFRFHITSLKPLNPKNAPDPFERKALEEFEQGKKEKMVLVKKKEASKFRYMAPLFTSKACLRCHGIQGYKEGDVRGGISVTLPAGSLLDRMHQNRILLIASALGILCVITLLLVNLSSRFLKKLQSAEQKLMEMASRDFLTGLFNRREGISRLQTELSKGQRHIQSLAVAMLDLDFFKKVNDTFGHGTGDQVLLKTADILQKTMRAYDVSCRYGGEEFLVIMPETSLTQAMEICERLRQSIAEATVEYEGKKIRLTVSIGVAVAIENDDADGLLHRADDALYAAKDAGRNRVVAGK